ncbi:hypothetical protein [uncultured Hyphomicrobium sp.]|jgi:hypothetical protein|uniref:hypothetical protein n=1 Tax=uncultured Hyphomicrobium sp. TaxID=194373 RepID=UPI0025D9FFBC|nr:hypothetical protein [uncultured Hyphomicrobium sp.]
MTKAFRISLAAAALLFAVPVAAVARPSSLYQPPYKAQSAGDTHQVAKKHHGKHARRNGCRLTHDGLVCGGGSNHGGQKFRRGKGRGN